MPSSAKLRLPPLPADPPPALPPEPAVLVVLLLPPAPALAALAPAALAPAAAAVVPAAPAPAAAIVMLVVVVVVVVGMLGASINGSMRAVARITPAKPFEPAVPGIMVMVLGGAVDVPPVGCCCCAIESSCVSLPPHAANSTQVKLSAVCTRVALPIVSSPPSLSFTYRSAAQAGLSRDPLLADHDAIARLQSPTM
jgi:hypothetical protein